MTSPRFSFHDSVGDRLLRSARHVRVELFRSPQHGLSVEFEVTGSLTRNLFEDEDDDGGSTTLTKGNDPESAIALAGEIFRSFARGVEGGGE